MTVILATALAIGVIIACVGPLYYCKKSTESRGGDEPSDAESSLVHIKISHPRHGNVLTHDGSANGQGSSDSKDKQITAKIVREESPRIEGNFQIVPVKPPRKRRNLHVDYSDNSSDRVNSREPSKNSILRNGRSSTNICSSSLTNQLKNTTNSSPEAYAVRKVVKGQVERCPRVSMPSNNETVNTFRKQSLYHKGINSIDSLSSQESCSKDERINKLSSVVGKKWRSLKRKLISSRSKKSTLPETIEDVDTRGSNYLVPTSRKCSSVRRTMMLRKDRLVDASTSTRISPNVADAKKRRNEDVDPDGNDESSNSRTDVLQDAVSMIQRRSANGKSVCDVKITGLSMDQSELLDLLEAFGGKSHSASAEPRKKRP